MMRIALIFLLTSSLAFSQEDSLDYYFDDAGLGSTKNIIKTDIAGYLGGSYVLAYERVFTEMFTVELGAGIWNGGNRFASTHEFPGERPFDSPTLQFYVHPKFYYQFMNSAGAPEYMHNGVIYRNRTVEIDDPSRDYSSIQFNDVMLTTGFQYFGPLRTTLEATFGFGVTYANYVLKSGVSAPVIGNTFDYMYNAGIKIGVRF